MTQIKMGEGERKGKQIREERYQSSLKTSAGKSRKILTVTIKFEGNVQQSEKLFNQAHSFSLSTGGEGVDREECRWRGVFVKGDWYV